VCVEWQGRGRKEPKNKLPIPHRVYPLPHHTCNPIHATPYMQQHTYKTPYMQIQHTVDARQMPHATYRSTHAYVYVQDERRDTCICKIEAHAKIQQMHVCAR